jgi:hypothetical protein
MTDVSETMAHVKEALNGIYRALLELHEAGDAPDKTLNEAFNHLAVIKFMLERWVRENNDDEI